MLRGGPPATRAARGRPCGWNESDPRVLASSVPEARLKSPWGVRATTARHLPTSRGHFPSEGMALGERPGGDVSRRFGLRHFGRIVGALVVAVTIGIATYASAEPAPPAYLPSGAPGPEVPIPGNDPDLVHSDESGAAFSIASPQHPADFPDPSYEWLYTLVWDDSPRGALGVRWVDAGETLVPVDCQARGERWHRYAWVFGDGISVRARRCEELGGGERLVRVGHRWHSRRS
jgi:hypothetical protein